MQRRECTDHLKFVTLLTVILPFAGLIAAVVLLWGVAFDWVYLAVFGGMFLLTGIGVTVGYHRLFTHRSFEASAPVRLALAVLGSMAVEGPVSYWAALHRTHHLHSDDKQDPHSPHHFEGGAAEGAKGGAGAVLRGFWHAHVGWMLKPNEPGLERHIPDLQRDPVVRWVSRTFPLWVVAGLALPAALGGLLTLSWTGAMLGFLWGGLARVFFVHHLTWSINSVCHLWGSRPFRTHDESRNNPVMGVLGLGEGWHNNHHAFPASARHGLRWWELDASYLVIRGLALCRLARGVRVPSRERIGEKRRGRRGAGGPRGGSGSEGHAA